MRTVLSRHPATTSPRVWQRIAPPPGITSKKRRSTRWRRSPRARDVAERIDAALDRIYILFTAGAWPEARDEALRTLALVEETQGDRAAGGILFILAYLAADDGQWAQATQHIHRLRHFYRGTRDERRILELDLLAAHLDFSRGRFGDATRSAQAIARLRVSRRRCARLLP